MRTVLLSLIAVTIAACNDGSTTPDRDLGGEEVCSPSATPISIAGRYALRLDLVLNLKLVAGCTGDACLVDSDSAASSLLLVDVTQTGSTTALSAKLCSLGVPPLPFKSRPQPVTVTPPLALLEALPAASASLALDGPSVCAGFTTQPLRFTMGARLADPSGDPLPAYQASAQPHIAFCDGAPTTRCSATTAQACVCDEEGDGKPGASFEAAHTPSLEDIDRVYVDQRVAVSLKGQVYPSLGEAGQRLRGAVSAIRFDQNVLGCHRAMGPGPRDCDEMETPFVTGLGPAATQSLATPSTFVAVPVPADETCAELIAAAPTLF